MNETPLQALARQVISLCGGATKISRIIEEHKLGEAIPVKTIHSWGDSRYGIPRWHRKTLIAVAEKVPVKLPADFTLIEAAPPAQAEKPAKQSEAAA